MANLTLKKQESLVLIADLSPEETEGAKRSAKVLKPNFIAVRLGNLRVCETPLFSA